MKKVGLYNHVSRNNDQGRLTTEEFVKRAKEVHGDKIIYEGVEYKNMNTKVHLKCAVCGYEFDQSPRHHLHRKHGCPKCNGGIPDTQEDFIRKIHDLYGGLYDVSTVNYIKSNKKVNLICHKQYKDGTEHGMFSIRPNSLLMGHGCPYCRQSIMENEIKSLLTNNNISFLREKTFEWLSYKKNLRLDFYLPEYNIAIECQGLQHFEPVDFGGKGDEWATERYEYVKKCDEFKKMLCSAHGIKIIYYTNIERDETKNMCKKLDKLLNVIKNGKQ